MHDEHAFLVEQLTVTYEKNAVLWDLNFTVPPGKMVGIIGPNGAGKSTLFKAALGIVKPISGKVLFFGKPFKEIRSKVAYVPQRSSVDWDFPITVLDLVLMGRYPRLGLFKRFRPADKQAALNVLERVGMQDFAHRQIKQLSGGQQQRTFLARALLQEADIYLLDEPFAGIDMASEKQIIDILNQLRLEGKTLFIVHHNLATLDQYFDWVIMLNTCLIANGPVAEVFHPENVMRSYGKNVVLLDEVAKLSEQHLSGDL